MRGLIRRFWQPALWVLFGIHVFLLPALFGASGAGEHSFPEWFPGTPAGLVAVQALLVGFAVPNAVFCLYAGFRFGLPVGMLSASLGTFLGALVAFGIGRVVGRPVRSRVLRRFPRAAAALAALGGSGARTVALTRLSPLFPFAVQNFGWAATGVPFRAYALGSFLAVPVGASFFAHLGAAGSAGATLAADRFSWSASLTVLGVVATFLLIRRIARLAERALDREGALAAARPES